MQTGEQALPEWTNSENTLWGRGDNLMCSCILGVPTGSFVGLNRSYLVTKERGERQR